MKSADMIDAIERDAQKLFLAAKALPIEGTEDEARFTQLGFQLGFPIDDVLRDATLPPGLALIPTDLYWSKIIDADGVQRAGVFYKGSPWDRKAHFCWSEG